MKRLLVLILVLTFLVVTGTLVAADAKTRLHESNDIINQPALKYFSTNGKNITEANRWHTMKNKLERAEW